jgi:hypothetical protein
MSAKMSKGGGVKSLQIIAATSDSKSRARAVGLRAKFSRILLLENDLRGVVDFLRWRVTFFGLRFLVTFPRALGV